MGATVSTCAGIRGRPVAEASAAAGFLPRNSTVVITHGEHANRHVYATGTSPVAGKLPLYVLVDRNSASASEIVAGALRDAKRGTLVGERTFGKALVQTTIPLRDGGALKLTTMRYLTPSGYDLAKRGLPPSIKAVDDPRPKPTRRAEGISAAAWMSAGPGRRPCGAQAGGWSRRSRIGPGCIASPRAPATHVGDLVTVSCIRAGADRRPRPASRRGRPARSGVRGPRHLSRGRGGADADESAVADDRGRRSPVPWVTTDPEGRSHDDALIAREGEGVAAVGTRRRRPLRTGGLGSEPLGADLGLRPGRST
jgi:hypothetical protein